MLTHAMIDCYKPKFIPNKVHSRALTHMHIDTHRNPFLTAFINSFYKIKFYTPVCQHHRNAYNIHTPSILSLAPKRRINVEENSSKVNFTVHQRVKVKLNAP